MKKLLFVALLLFVGSHLSAQIKRNDSGVFQYKITVLDENNQPLKGATVTLPPEESRKETVSLRTNKDGVCYALSSKLLEYLTVSKEGYIAHKVTYDEKSNGENTVILKKDPNYVPKDKKSSQKKKKTK